MTERIIPEEARISHEEARRALRVPWDFTRLMNYINQQAALEADTVSRAESGSMQQRLATMTQNNATLQGQLIALQAELERAAVVKRLEPLYGALAYLEAEVSQYPHPRAASSRILRAKELLESTLPEEPTNDRYPGGVEVTERISHEEARRLAGGIIAEQFPATSSDLLAYVTQQQALEADTVSRAEHEEALARVREAWAKESKAEKYAHRLTEDQLEAQLAAANARVVRLEEAASAYLELREAVMNLIADEDGQFGQGTRFPALECMLGLAPKDAPYYAPQPAKHASLSTAPQASTEQASPSPVEESFCEGLYAGAMGLPAQPAPGGTERKRHTVDCGGFDKDCECNPWKPSPTPAEPQGHWSDCSDCVRDGGHCKRHPAGPPPVDYVTYEVLIEALRASLEALRLNNGSPQFLAKFLADRLEKASGR